MVDLEAQHTDLAAAVQGLFPELRSVLSDLVRHPSVSAAGDVATMRRAADAVAGVLGSAGVDVRLLQSEDNAPTAVYGHAPGPTGTPTVLLYAHYDVQPAGDETDWESPPFEPVLRGGRLYGRGASDDKSGIVTHLGALRVFGGRPPVGLKFIIEGEEEIGSPHLAGFLDANHELLAAEVIVVADSEHWRIGQPALTTSLRGLIDCEVEVRVLEAGVHSGQFGGPVPDALSALSRLLATLHDEDGRTAVTGLVSSESPELDLDDAELREQAGVLPGVELLGSGYLTSRLWTHPAVSVLGIDAPSVSDSINQLVPVARAKVSVRLAPGDEPARAMDALVSHLEARAPWGTRVTVAPGAAAAPFRLDATGPAYDAFRVGTRAAWGRDPVEIGIGGSIPFVAEIAAAFPAASIILTGVGEPSSRIHGPNESQDLRELERNVAAEAIAIELLGRQRAASGSD